MKQAEKTTRHYFSVAARSSGVLGLFLTFALLVTSLASASYEQVATFADIGEGKLSQTEATGIAVNTTGAGGVPAGTVYVVTKQGARVLRYSADGEFREAWGWGVAEGSPADEFQRCGPDGDVAHPVCNTGSKNIGSEGTGNSGNGIGQLNEPKGLAVDQTTGNVYVYNGGRVNDSNHLGDVIQVFNADGSQLLTSFGEFGPDVFHESVEDSPEKFHQSDNNDIAVDGSGVLYVYDRAQGGGVRVMVFRPQSPGDYEHYVYAGRANDIGDGYGPRNPSSDYSGNLFAGNEGAIYKFASGEPDSPACEFKIAKGGLVSMTADPQSGEVFYFSYKDQKIHQLGACNSQGVFAETGTLAAGTTTAMTVNPILPYEGSRPPGVLYAAAAGFVRIFAPAEVSFPVIDSESVSSVTSSTATLGAQINPKGSQTRYAFQYLTNAAYEANEAADRFAGAVEAPLGGADLGTGQSSLGAATALVGLAPDTEYRYRVIATSHCEPDDEENVCEVTGAAQAFHTFPVEAPGLPDGRAYELVSPAKKNGGEVIPADEFGSCTECKPFGFGVTFPMQSSPDGEAIVYEGFPFSFTEGAKFFDQYLAKRTASGWQTTILSPLLQGRAPGEGHLAFNAELTRGLFYQGGGAPVLSPEAPAEYDNLYTQSTASPAALSPLLKSESPNRHAKLTYAGASSDLSHAFFAANDALTGETPFAPEAIDGGEDENNLYESVGGELRLVNVLPGNTATVPGASFGSGQKALGSSEGVNLSHAVSEDGSRVFWSDEAGQVYVREDGESTRAIPDPGKFLTASADGSKLLLGNGHLYDLQTEAIVDLSEGKGGFMGIVGQSEDLSHIYFVDTAILTGEEENDHGAKAQDGKYNLYSWHEGAASFIAALADDGGISIGLGDWQESPSRRTAEASPDGRWVAFLARTPLTGYDNFGPSCIQISGTDEFTSGSCSEAFLYDSATGKLSCASCNPTGSRPIGGSALKVIAYSAASIPQPRYLTDSGRLYFDSRDSLSPFDTNNGVADVYQYEPEGIGSCKRQGGCVSLISAGSEPIDSNFLAADATGKNVFFTTRDQLVLKDRDDAIDLYVAREGGGIAAETETSRGECQGEACQAVVSPPNDPTPGSTTFEGAGNVDEKKANKKSKKKKKHAKKNKKSHKRSHGRANNNRGGAK